MRMNFKQLKGLDVLTMSGTMLGHVFEIVLEIEGQLVAQYVVRPSVISSKEYLVSRDQIVRFEENRVIVDDNVVADEVGEGLVGRVTGMETGGVALVSEE